MERSFNYAILQLAANPTRGERLNVGIVVFDEHSVDVFPARNLGKVRAISENIDTITIHQAIENIKSADRYARQDGLESPEDRVSAITRFSPLMLSPLGMFKAGDASAYQSQVDRLVALLVEPEPATRKPQPKPRSRLFSSIKSAFRAERILAQKYETIDSHRVVVNEKLVEGLSADLLLKNGAMHVMQTVDASHSERARTAIQEIGISALVFEQARIQFSEVETKPKLIYSASSLLEYSIAPALHVAEHQGAELVNWESRDDRVRFIVEISSLAQPTTGQKRANFSGVHASSRRNTSLN